MRTGRAQRYRLFTRRFVLGGAALIAATLASRSAAEAADPEKMLYSFCAQGGTSCTDGFYPNASLIMDASGNLYGTTVAGANQNAKCIDYESCGAVFELAPPAKGKTAWTEQVLYSFCAETKTNLDFSHQLGASGL